MLRAMLRAIISASVLGLALGACFSEDTGNDTGNTSGGDDACQSYCERLQNNCTGDFQQFGTVDDCKATCKFYPAGGDGDQSGHSLGCRATKAANAAEGDQATFCPQAGPTGGGICGSPCESFCKLAMAVCTGGNAQWNNEQECLNECLTYPDLNAVPFSSNVTSGDSFACRMYHLNVAAVVDPDIHCTHIDTDSPPCSDGGGSSTGGSGSGGSDTGTAGGTSAGSAGTGG